MVGQAEAEAEFQKVERSRARAAAKKQKEAAALQPTSRKRPRAAKGAEGPSHFGSRVLPEVEPFRGSPERAVTLMAKLKPQWELFDEPILKDLDTGDVVSLLAEIGITSAVSTQCRTSVRKQEFMLGAQVPRGATAVTIDQGRVAHSEGKAHIHITRGACAVFHFPLSNHAPKTAKMLEFESALQSLACPRQVQDQQEPLMHSKGGSQDSRPCRRGPRA